MESAQDEVIQPMRRLRHLITGKDNDFEISSPDFLSHLWNQLTGALVILTGVISSIGLVVGGIGIMNIMLISVTERTHESACARRSARAAPISGCSFFWASLSYLWVGIGFTISVSVGLFFGYYPAILAPIVCLGYE